MGFSSSCNIFETFSTALEWIARDKLHASLIIHILDDFLFIAPSETKCQVGLNNFLCICRRIGVPIGDAWRAACLSNRFCLPNFSSITTGGLLFTRELLTI